MSTPTPKPTLLEELTRLQQEVAAKSSPTPDFNLKIASLVDLAVSTLPLGIMTPNTRRSFVEQVKESGDMTGLLLLMKAVDEDKPFSPYSTGFDSSKSVIDSIPRCDSAEELAQPESSMSNHKGNSQSLSSFFSTDGNHEYIRETDSIPRSSSGTGERSTAMTAGQTNVFLPAPIALSSASTIKAGSPSLSPQAIAITQIQHGNPKPPEKQSTILEAKKAKADGGNLQKIKSGSRLSNEGEPIKIATHLNDLVSPTLSSPKDSPSSSNNERSVSRCGVTGQRPNSHSPNPPLKIVVSHRKNATTISSLNDLKELPPMETTKEDMGMPEPFPAPNAAHLSSPFPSASASPSTPRSEGRDALPATPNGAPAAAILTLSQLQSRFPTPEDDHTVVKSWIKSALQRRGSADDSWIQNVVWVGNDLYVLPQQEIRNALTRFEAGYDVTLGVTRDIVGAKIVRERELRNAERNFRWIRKVLGITFLPYSFICSCFPNCVEGKSYQARAEADRP
jgi:hypothetical protein